MNLVFSQEQQMLRDTVREFLAAKSPIPSVRAAMEADRGFDDSLWRDMAELGLLGMHIPEEFGGAGFTHQELGIVQEELGRALAAVPFFSTVVLGVNLLLLGGSQEQKRSLLPGVAAGDHRLAVAIVEPHPEGTSEPVTAASESGDDQVVISGVGSYVVDGHTADTLLVGARRAELVGARRAELVGARSAELVGARSAELVGARNGDSHLDFYAVPRLADGVTTDLLPTMDLTRKQSQVRFHDVRVPLGSRLARGGDELLFELHDLAAIGLAFEQVGGAQRCLEMAVDYAGTRHQFGRPIGSFQAIKHKCADMLVEVESARSTAHYAAWTAASRDDDLPVAAALARVRCSDAFFHCAAENIQIHGGIGFTWEHDAHLYFKRAKTSQLILGDVAHWRTKLGDRLGL